MDDKSETDYILHRQGFKEMNMPKSEGEMTVREAGRKGGQTVKDKHGPDFFKEIGRKGGMATSASHGHDFYQEIGRKGGQKGGARVRELIAKAKASE